MFRNYLLTAITNLLKYKMFSFINICGLTTGLASTLLIGLFVLDELSYDTHYADAERIYRISRDFHQQNIYLAANAPQVAGLLKEYYPEIEQAARVFGGQALLSRNDYAFYEANIRFADNEFFDIFNLEWVAGEPAQALVRPFTVVLTESVARKYFGTLDVLGQSLLLENAAPLEVTGVIRDLPHNTHLNLGPVVSLNSLPLLLGERFLNSWSNNNFHTYIKLRDGVGIDTISSRFPEFLNRHIEDNATSYSAMVAMPLRDIHLHSTRQFEMKPAGSMTNVYVFSAAALFILLIACCNFMNLSTAGATHRSHEVGVRKSLGASRQQIAWQFVGETLLLTLVAGVLAVALVELMLPFFNGFLGKELSLRQLADWRLTSMLILTLAMTGLLAGSYPAFYLSAFKPVQVLKNTFVAGGAALFRSALVVLQFSIAIVLVVATLVVLLQMRYARNIELGFEKEQILVLTGSPTIGLGPQWDTLRAELLAHPEILAVTASGQTPLETNTNAIGVVFEGEAEGRGMPMMKVDYDFFATYEVPVLAGRDFSGLYPNDRVVQTTGPGAQPGDYGVVLNRLAAEQLGWTPEAALGKRVRGLRNSESDSGGVVVGVVENSYFESVRTPLKTLLFYMPERVEGRIAHLQEASIRLSGNNLQETLGDIEELWRNFMPGFPLERHFLNADFETLYLEENRLMTLFKWFALLAVFIACMGLYGLASFNAEHRRKEVGVRKAMGGSVWSIVLLLTNEFSKLVLLSNLIAWPVAYFAMSRWLENFAYRIDLSPLVFIGSGLIALCIAWVTVGGTAAKAASQKPVLALRYE